MIDNEIENNGIGIAFSPRLERIGNNTGFDTVSYTHLDVYKRQLLTL